MKRTIYGIWEGGCNVFESSGAQKNIETWCKHLPQNQKFHLWLGPSMSEDHNLKTLQEWIKREKLGDKIELKFIDKEFAKRKTEPAFETIDYNIFDLHCDYRQYSNFYRYQIARKYLMENNYKSAFYIDIPDILLAREHPQNKKYYNNLFGLLKKYFQNKEEGFSKHYNNLFELSEKHGAVIITHEIKDVKAIINSAFVLSNTDVVQKLCAKLERHRPRIFSQLEKAKKNSWTSSKSVDDLYKDLIDNFIGGSLYSSFYFGTDSVVKMEKNENAISSGSTFFADFVNKYNQEQKKHKRMELPQYSSRNLQLFECNFANSWINKKSKYVLDEDDSIYFALPTNFYKTKQDMLNAVIKQTILIIKHTGTFILPYHLACISKYVKTMAPSSVNLDDFTQKGIIKETLSNKKPLENKDNLGKAYPSNNVLLYVKDYLTHLHCELQKIEQDEIAVLDNKWIDKSSEYLQKEKKVLLDSQKKLLGEERIKRNQKRTEKEIAELKSLADSFSDMDFQKRKEALLKRHSDEERIEKEQIKNRIDLFQSHIDVLKETDTIVKQFETQLNFNSQKKYAIKEISMQLNDAIKKVTNKKTSKNTFFEIEANNIPQDKIVAEKTDERTTIYFKI